MVNIFEHMFSSTYFYCMYAHTYVHASQKLMICSLVILPLRWRAPVDVVVVASRKANKQMCYA